MPHPDYQKFVGREDQSAEIISRLRPYPKSQYSLICIDGPGGIGKSALALHVASELESRYETLPDDERFERIVWTSAKLNYLDSKGIKRRMRSAGTLHDILRTICTTIDRRDILLEDTSTQVALTYQMLRERRTLLIFDNLETVSDPDVEAFIRELVPPTKAILTSRQRMDIMAYPVRLGGLPAADAETLIRQHCQTRQLDLTSDDMGRLYALTGGLPLAIVWSLGLIHLGESVENMLARVIDPEADLARFCFEEIIQQISRTPAYQVLLAAVCFGHDSNADGLAGTAALKTSVCDGAIGRLLTLSLMNRSKTNDQRGDMRYYVLPLTRAYAQAELGRYADVKRAYYSRCLGYLKDACRKTQDQYYWRFRTYDFYGEGKNILAALPIAYEFGTADDLVWLANAACEYLDHMGDWQALLEVCDDVIEFADSLSDKAALGNFNSHKGWILMHRDDLDAAEHHLDEALKNYHAIGNSEGECIVLHRLSGVSRKRKNFKGSKEWSTRALRIADTLGSGDLRALINVELGKLERDRHDWDAAALHFSSVREWFEGRAAQTPSDEVLARSVWGHIAALTLGRYLDGLNPKTEDLNEAKTLCLKSLDFFADHGTKSYFATLNHRLAMICAALGEIEEASAYARQAILWFERLGMSKDLEEVVNFMASIATHASVTGE